MLALLMLQLFSATVQANERAAAVLIFWSMNPRSVPSMKQAIAYAEMAGYPVHLVNTDSVSASSQIVPFLQANAIHYTSELDTAGTLRRQVGEISAVGARSPALVTVWRMDGFGLAHIIAKSRD
ncbi:MAG: hypothetical protein AAFV53_05475 [Myxococcota bacterium]